MYFYYEHFHASGSLPDVYDMVLSSLGFSTSINWKSPEEKKAQQLFTTLAKSIELKSRDYNEQTHIWTFIGPYGAVLIAQLESFITQGILSTSYVRKITNLQYKVSINHLDVLDKLDNEEELKTPKYKAEDFFYAPAAPVHEIAGIALYTKLSGLLEIDSSVLTSSDTSILKKAYRKAALRLHPDRNNGDGSKMSELNMLWNIFNQQA